MNIQELKNEAAKSEIKVSELLRKAKIVLKDCGKQDILNWLEKEINGYEKGENVPEYRIIHGEPKGFNPYNGWIPFIIDNPKNKKTFLKGKRDKQ